MIRDIEKWLKSKKNRQTLFFIIGIIMLYMYIKRKGAEKGTSDYTSLGYTSGSKTDLPGSTTPTRNYLYYAEALPYFQTSIELFTLARAGSTFSDTTPGDYVENGQRKRATQGRTYVAYYWINEVAFAADDDKPKNFENVTLPTGCLISIRKVYVDQNFASTYTQLFSKQWEMSPSNKAGDVILGDLDAIYRTAIQSITT